MCLLVRFLCPLQPRFFVPFNRVLRHAAGQVHLWRKNPYYAPLDYRFNVAREERVLSLYAGSLSSFLLFKQPGALGRPRHQTQVSPEQRSWCSCTLPFCRRAKRTKTNPLKSSEPFVLRPRLSTASAQAQDSTQPAYIQGVYTPCSRAICARACVLTFIFTLFKTCASLCT